MFFFLSSVEVNNFLKIDENQNEDIEDELPESPVSRTGLTDSLIFSPKCANVFLNVPFDIFQMFLHSRSSLAEETQ